MIHKIDPRLLSRQVDVALVGVGGNGSQMLTGLARLHMALLALGHPGGLRVTAWDPDRVSEANVGRQMFSPADVGLNKAVVLVHRLNAFYGLNWEAKPVAYAHEEYSRRDLVISCVDTAAARRDIHKLIEKLAPVSYVVDHSYWLDLGNRQ